MSIFISTLAFEQLNVSLIFDERLGILLGSGASGLPGYLLLKNGLSSESGS